MEEDATLSNYFYEGAEIGGRYKILKKVGQGTFGVVFLVKSKELNGYYALKTMKEQSGSELENRELFKKEALIWINLTYHPNIVKAFAIDEVSGRVCIITEYVAPDLFGVNTLREYLEKWPPNLLQTIQWSVDFCHGIEHAYANGIRCHRDIKPENILISLEGTLKITDFGLSGTVAIKNSDHLTTLSPTYPPSIDATAGSRIWGTRLYMAPEHFLGGDHCDVRSDIFSFGIVIYEMASSGAHPFLKMKVELREIGDEEFLDRQKEAIFDPLNTSPLNDIINKCLKKEPNQRYLSFTSLRKDLEDLYENLSGEKIPNSQVAPIPYWDYLNRGSSLITLKRYSGALICYEKALELGGKNAIIWYSKGICLLELKRYEEALADFDKAIEVDPKCSVAWSNKSMALQKIGKSEEAMECCNTAIDLDASNNYAWKSKGLIFSDMELFKNAIECYNSALVIDPTDLDVLNNKGIAILKTGDPTNAILIFDKVLAINPCDSHAWLNKSNCLLELGNENEALFCLDQATQIVDEKDAAWRNVWNNKGVLLQKLHKYSDAVECYKKIIAISPEDFTILQNLGNTYYKMEDFLNAHVCYCAAIKQQPEISFLWKAEGKCLKWMGKYSEAISHLEKAIEFSPVSDDKEKAEILSEISVCLNFSNYISKALEKIDEAICLDSQNSLLFNYKGVIFSSNNDYNGAILSFNKAIELDNTNAAAYYNKGMALVNSNLPQKAIRCLSKACELKPDKLQYQIAQIQCLRILGDYRKAIAVLTILQSRAPDNSDQPFYIAMCFAALGEVEQARKYFDRAIEVNNRLTKKR